ncbi:hypothetical protein [Ulvibacter antarcticus]|uniref:Uncharacterized protein n=1 Tax=Ulvibacter antarcticus TaxID=442714 RepID=A0A3L9YZ61_9FLAO|nr:hypothetical protein [Ulvibacter antarcticus]RMA65936.1 hypothetical protein BXY75_0352 [Ulvibacter antarcticus]
MPIILRRIFLFLILSTAILVIYFEIVKEFGFGIGANLLFLSLITIMHISTDKPRSKIFISVLLLFIASMLLNIINYYLIVNAIAVLYANEIFLIIGFVLMMREVIRECRKEFVIKNYSWPVAIILILDGIIIYKIMALIDEFHLSISHVLYGFIFTILKLLVLSIGLIYYFMSSYKTRKVSFLIGALALFFMSDIIETSNYLFFIKDPLVAGGVLNSGLSMLGVVLFYLYCTYPEQEDIMDNNESFFNTLL